MLLTEAIRLFITNMTTVDKAKETIKGYTIELNLINRYLMTKYNGPVYLEEITVQDLEDYLQELKAQGKAPASRSRTIYIIRAFYNFCYKKDYLDKNIAVKLETVPVPEKERTFLTEVEMKILIAAIKPPIIKLIVSTLFYTGMRISECLNLLIEDISFEEGVITVRNTKNKRDRQIPIHDELMPLLKNYYTNWRYGEANPYFFSLNNTFKISPDYVNRVLQETTRSLGWKKHVTCHILRHSFASNLVAKNVNIVNIQKLLGHSNLSTTSIYTHTKLDELKKAINAI